MNGRLTRWFLGSRYPLAALAGLLLALAFPKAGIAGLAWIAPGLIAASALGKTGGQRFRIGYVAGLAYYYTSLYWLLLIPYRWHGIPFGPAAGWLALGSFLALFPAGWLWLVGKTRGQSSESVQPAAGSARALGFALPTAWTGRTLWALTGAATWVAMEMTLARILGGFPWDLLGVSQYRMTPLIQIAAITGVYGISFLMVWFSLSLVSAGAMMVRHPSARSACIAEIFPPMLAVAILFNLGLRQVRHAPEAGRTLRVTLVQPSIPQTLIWDEGADDERLREVVRLSETALTNETDLLVWPESAVPKLLRYYPETLGLVTGLARRHHVWMILGADDMEQKPASTNAEDRLFFNSSFLISPEGLLSERYLKRNLVMFGEYVPCQRWLPFLKWLTPAGDGFTPGARPAPFRMPSLGATASVLICFEDVFPHLGPDAASSEIDFLVNITNDGWFGNSAAQWQHAATAVFRAVENGLPLVRCANNGVTCWVDAQGRMQDPFQDDAGGVYGAGFKTIRLPLPDSQAKAA